MPLDPQAVDKYSNLTIDDEGKFMEFLGYLLTKPISTMITKVGNSAGVTIPKPLLEHLEIEVGDAVKIIIIKDEDWKRGSRK